jgi:hypothetical protein
MGIRVTRLTEFGVNISVFSGKITREVLLEHYAALGAADRAESGRWISYFDPSADLTELDLATFTELKRVVGAKVRELYGDGRLANALVCDSRINQPILNLWRSYVGRDGYHPSDPIVLSSLKAACDRLGLPDTARDQLTAAVGVDCSRAPDAANRSSRAT